jgi:predicted nuclease with RNAse H fold
MTGVLSQTEWSWRHWIDYDATDRGVPTVFSTAAYEDASASGVSLADWIERMGVEIVRLHPEATGLRLMRFPHIDYPQLEVVRYLGDRKVGA